MFVCVCVCGGGQREGRSGFGLFHWPAPGWANFSNLQTVWAQAQGSEAKVPALQDDRLANSSHSCTHITSGISDGLDTLFQGGKPRSQGELGLSTKREGDNGTRRDEKDKWRKDLRSAILKLSETEKIRQSEVT